MQQEWIERLSGRFVVVAGKGGVGKTTTAGALALALADAGEPTHLVSVDPAHSVGDLFDAHPLGPAPRPAPCTPLLTLEELDAQAYAAAWIEANREAALELIRRGTYFDDEESRRLLDLSLPGLDEVAAALRLVELADGPARRIVVDTAPTGHLLRLLDAGRWLSGWVSAFRAMAAKAAAVAEAMLHRPVRFQAEARLDAIEAAVARFEREILPAADFVVVSRPGAVVAAETARLERELEARGLRVAARVSTGAAPDGFDGWVVPAAAGLRGCDGLRRWGAPAAPAAPAAEPLPGPVAGAASPQALLAAPREILFFVGKGGVGKSTCAAAAALALAATREVTLLGADPAGSLGDVLGRPVTTAGERVAPRLVARQIDPAAADLAGEWSPGIERLLERLGMGGSAALDRAVLESLRDAAPPGLDELAALLTLVDEHGADRLLVVDAAPTGHFLRLLELPGHALEWTHALLRILARYGVALGLDEDVRRVLRFAKRLKQLRLALADPERAAAVVVTLDEEVVAAETRRLTDALARAGLAVAAVVVNRAGAGSAAPAGSLLAPAMPAPPVGAAALDDFFSRWERAS